MELMALCSSCFVCQILRTTKATFLDDTPPFPDAIAAPEAVCACFVIKRFRDPRSR